MSPRSRHIFWRPFCPSCAGKMIVLRREFRRGADEQLGITVHCRCEHCGKQFATPVPADPPRQIQRPPGAQPV